MNTLDSLYAILVTSDAVYHLYKIHLDIMSLFFTLFLVYYADILGHIWMMWIFIVGSDVRYEMHI